MHHVLIISGGRKVCSIDKYGSFINWKFKKNFMGSILSFLNKERIGVSQEK